MLGYRHRRLANIKPAMGERVVFAGLTCLSSAHHFPRLLQTLFCVILFPCLESCIVTTAFPRQQEKADTGQ